jgi:hypothetical protein
MQRIVLELGASQDGSCEDAQLIWRPGSLFVVPLASFCGGAQGVDVEMWRFSMV